ncbi:MAG: CAP domain-containing protein, partial [Gammaproteobacteria bacterium]|nr:CAP domain-containing protein [Gammaproteobacteria bacterium]
MSSASGEFPFSMIWLSLILLLVVESVSASTTAFDYINDLRQQAGMQPFVHSTHLQESAQHHADYLAINRDWGHAQLPGRQGFSGAVPMERM